MYVPRSARHTFVMNKVTVTKNGDVYSITGVDRISSTERIDIALERDVDVCDEKGVLGVTNFNTETAEFTDSVEIDNIPIDDYMTFAVLRDSLTDNVMGGLSGEYTTPAENSVLYVYVPSLAGFDEAADEAAIAQLYEDCGLSLISFGQYTFTGVCS